MSIIDTLAINANVNLWHFSNLFDESNIILFNKGFYAKNRILSKLCLGNDNETFRSSIGLTVTLANDLKALKCHFKFENCDTEDKLKGENVNDKSDRDRQKENSYNNTLKNIMKDDFKTCLKGKSTLVQADDRKGDQIVRNCLKVLDDKERRTAFGGNNNDKSLLYDKLIQVNYISKDCNSKLTQVKRLYLNAQLYLKNSKSYNTNNNNSNMLIETTCIIKINNLIKVNNNTHNDIGLNKQYKQTIDFPRTLLLSTIKLTIYAKSNTYDLHIIKRETYDPYKLDIFNDMLSLSYYKYNLSLKNTYKSINN